MKEMFVSKRNGAVAELISNDGVNVVMQVSGKEGNDTFTIATFKRWWKKAPVVSADIAQEVDEKDNALPAIETRLETNAITAHKPKKTGPIDFKDEVFALQSHLEALAEERGLTIYEAPKTKGFFSIKHDGHMVMNYMSSRIGLTLWVRKELTDYVTVLDRPVKLVNHNVFPLRPKLQRNNIENQRILEELLDRSLEVHKKRKGVK